MDRRQRQRRWHANDIYELVLNEEKVLSASQQKFYVSKQVTVTNRKKDATCGNLQCRKKLQKGQKILRATMKNSERELIGTLLFCDEGCLQERETQEIDMA